MRIGIDIRTTQLGSGVRGIGTYIFDLIEGVARLAPENEYVLIAFPDLPLPERLQSLPASCRVTLLPTRRLHATQLFIRRRVRRVWRLYYQQRQREHRRGLERIAEREKLDVLHLATVTEEFFYADGCFRCRVVKTLYDLIPLVLREEFLREWHGIHWYIYESQIASYRRADAVAAISEATRQDGITRLSLPPEKVHVVPPAISPDFFPVTDAARRKDCLARYGLCGPYFLFCSGNGVNKNRERVLQAFAQFAERHPSGADCHLVFAGPQTADHVAPLKLQAFELGLSARQFKVTGFVPDEDLVTLYSAATALVTPSLYEGFGLPAAQAMACGTPVIASDRSSHPEVVGDAGLLVDPYCVEAIADAMLRLAQDPVLRADLSARGQERVRRFSGENQARAMLAVYRDSSTEENGQGK